jgi:uncharacterized membrane protein
VELASWGATAPAIIAAFLASLVEAIEAFTIVLAVGTVRGWRPATLGTSGALGLLVVLVLVIGPELDRVPIYLLRLFIGVLLLLFGMRWLRKVVLEGLEVVFIVLAVGAGHGLLWPAGLGALIACVLVLAIGLLVHRPLARIPENSLKFGVGVMLSAFGVFWTGEGLGIVWPGHDFAVVVLVGLFFVASLLAVPLARRMAPQGA